MTESPENLVTIGEIAARARHLASDPYAFVERARHWAKIGLLCAVDKVGQGTGRHALFPASEAYMAALVNAFAEAGIPPAGSRAVADVQGTIRNSTLPRWLRAKTKSPLFVEIRFYPAGRSAIGVHYGKWERSAAEPKAQPMTKIIIDLGVLFESVAEATAKLADA